MTDSTTWDAYDRVLMALLSGSENPCDAVHEALRAIADFAITEGTHGSSLPLARAIVHHYEQSLRAGNREKA